VHLLVENMSGDRPQFDGLPFSLVVRESTAPPMSKVD
jgi:hypothetical protein